MIVCPECGNERGVTSRRCVVFGCASRLPAIEWHGVTYAFPETRQATTDSQEAEG